MPEPAPFPLSPEQFYATRVEPALDGRVDVDALITALRDYRTHLEDIWAQRVKYHTEQLNADRESRDAMQRLYDGYVVGSRN